MRATVLPAAVLLSACARELPEEPPTYTADWAGVTSLFADECAACHGAGTDSPVQLPGSIARDIAAGTGVYVVPFDPEGSALWRVVSGQIGPDDYGFMPYGRALLEPATVAHVREWILAGAVVDVTPDDCDGDGEPDDATIAASSYYVDVDGDGFGAGEEVLACAPPAGHATRSGDCDDADADAYPGAPESCDAVGDLNCDGSVGMMDGDGDGHAACEECNDADAQAFPGAPERCNDRDDDCDGSLDEEAVDAPAWYPDGDGDGYGADDGAFTACDPPPDAVADGGDCADDDPSVSPGATVDATDGRDNDCDGTIDEDGALSHAIDIQPLWDAHCTSCHDPPAPAGGLDLSGDAWSAIVGVASDDVPSMELIAPGDPDASYLWHKLNNTQSSVGGGGTRMPKGGSALDPVTLGVIESWILGGAEP